MTDANPRPPAAGRRCGCGKSMLAFCPWCMAKLAGAEDPSYQPPAAGAAGESLEELTRQALCWVAAGDLDRDPKSFQTQMANRARACLRACAGLADPERDVAELVAAARLALRHMTEHSGTVCGAVPALRAALARIDARCAGGGAAGGARGEP